MFKKIEPNKTMFKKTNCLSTTPGDRYKKAKQMLGAMYLTIKNRNFFVSEFIFFCIGFGNLYMLNPKLSNDTIILINVIFITGGLVSYLVILIWCLSDSKTTKTTTNKKTKTL